MKSLFLKILKSKNIAKSLKGAGIAGLILLMVTFTADAQQIAVKGEMVYTSAGDPIENGVVLISDGRIEQVGPEASVQIPSGYEVHEAKVVTPGFIDAHSVVGLAGIYPNCGQLMAITPGRNWWEYCETGASQQCTPAMAPELLSVGRQ